jgi:sugar diacid utilization regulator
VQRAVASASGRQGEHEVRRRTDVDAGGLAPAEGASEPRPARQVLRENESLKRLIAINNRLSRLALQGAGLEVISEVLASSTGQTVAVLDPALKVMAAASGREGSQPDVSWVSQDPQLAPVLAAVAESREALRLPAAADLGRPGCVIAPVLFGDEVLAYLVTVQSGDGEAGDFELLVTEHAATVYAIEMTRSRAVAEVSDRVKDDLVDALLGGHVRDAREGRTWAQALGYDLERPHRVVCLLPERLTSVTGEADAKDPATTALRRRVLQALGQLLAARAPSAIASARQDELVVIVPEGDGQAAPGVSQLGEIAIRHLRQLVKGAELTVGVGDRCREPSQLAQSYQQARQAVAIARRIGRSGQVVVFEDLGIYRLLFQVPDDRQLRAFAERVLGPVIAYDREHGAGLVRTLAVYLRQNGSPHAAAARLHVHPNTVNYRLSRIAEIASLCLNDHEDRLAAAVAVKILEVLDEA